MNAQEIFNRVYRGLESQGFRQSVGTYLKDNGGYGVRCAYRGDNGEKCAVGWLIPDEEYQPILERVSVSDTCDLLSTLGYLSEEHRDLVEELQQLHDREPVPSDMCGALQLYAVRNGLTVPAETQTQ